YWIYLANLRGESLGRLFWCRQVNILAHNVVYQIASSNWGYYASVEMRARASFSLLSPAEIPTSSAESNNGALTAKICYDAGGSTDSTALDPSTESTSLSSSTGVASNPARSRSRGSSSTARAASCWASLMVLP